MYDEWSPALAQCSSDKLFFLHEVSNDESARTEEGNNMSTTLLVASAAASIAMIAFCGYAAKRRSTIDDSFWRI